MVQCSHELNLFFKITRSKSCREQILHELVCYYWMLLPDVEIVMNIRDGFMAPPWVFQNCFAKKSVDRALLKGWIDEPTEKGYERSFANFWTGNRMTRKIKVRKLKVPCKSVVLCKDNTKRKHECNSFLCDGNFIR